MTDIVERLVALANSLGGTEEDDILAGVSEIEQLRTRLAIQFGMHPGGDLAKATSAEIERLRDENELLSKTTDADGFNAAMNAKDDEIEQLQTERDDYKRENERLIKTIAELRAQRVDWP